MVVLDGLELFVGYVLVGEIELQGVGVDGDIADCEVIGDGLLVEEGLV
jgi:hypothetical protein